MAESALGQGVGPPLGGVPMNYQQSGSGWVIPDLGTPRQPVALDPAGPPWIKILGGPGGAGVFANVGDTFTIHERLVISGTLPWTDWHEQILEPGWEWVPSAPPLDFQANGATAPGLSNVVTPGTPTQGGSIDFYFNSLAPGTDIDIFKTIAYTGAGLPVPTPPFQGHIRMFEFPTPEPGTTALMAIGGLALVPRRRRRQAI
jgi:hypothetical protein